MKQVKINEKLNTIHIIPSVVKSSRRLVLSKATMYRGTRSIGRAENLITDNWALYYNEDNEENINKWDTFYSD